MPLTAEAFESLPYIDVDLTADERAAAEALITASLAPTDTLHPSIPSLPPAPTSSSLMAPELDRVAAQQPLVGGIDLTRYEVSDDASALPSAAVLRSAYYPDASTAADTTPAPNALAATATNHTYVTRRQANLTLLEQFGKNAWLVGNMQLEAVLGSLERELAAARDDVDRVAVARRDAQQAVAAELQMLGETWRKGVARVVETEIAAEQVRAQILQRRREAAAAH